MLPVVNWDERYIGLLCTILAIVSKFEIISEQSYKVAYIYAMITTIRILYPCQKIKRIQDNENISFKRA